MARFYANENFPLPVVEELRRLGHDVLTTLEAERTGKKIPDEEVLEFAVSGGRAVLTNNRKHFLRPHRAQPNHTGIVLCTFDPDFVRQAGRIHVAVATVNDLSGQVLRVNRPPV